MTAQALKRELMDEVKMLPAHTLRELKAYVYFLKVRETMEPSQLYFWTKRWQAWEHEAEVDKRAGRVVGDGTLKGLLKALRRR